MPTQDQIQAAIRFRDTAVCECGRPMDQHGTTTEEVRASNLNCVLTRDEVPMWNTITVRGNVA